MEIQPRYIICKYCKHKIRVGKFISHSNLCREKYLEEKEKKLKDLKQLKNDLLLKNKKAKIKNEKLETKKELNSITYYMIWDDIYFEENKIRFSPNRINAILHSVEFKGVIPELNIIKDEYFKRLFDREVYKLKFFKSNLLVSKSPDWEKILNKIEIGKQYFEFIATKKSKIGPSLSIDEALKLYNSSFKKSHYLKFLASIQFKEFKLIPIIEVIGSLREKSFIFRLTSKANKTIFIWENVNENRATHVFVSPAESSENILISLESFICTQMTSKRSLLYMTDKENSNLKKDLGYLTSIRHDNIDSYKRQIKTILRK
jgi:hypothetical protein